MSLALAIDQIQRPTWWHENERDQSGNKHIKAETVVMRANILEWLRERGGKVQGIEVSEHFGLTNSQLWHYVNPMVEDGLIRKYKPRHDKSLLEAVAK